MTTSAGTAYIDFRPRLDGLEAELKRAVTPITSRIGKTLSDLGGKLTRTVTLPIVAFGAAGVKAAIDVDKGLREVNTLFGLTGKAADDSFKALKGGVADLSSEIGVAQDVLVGGLYQAISAGVPRENAFTFLQVAAKAAIAGVTDTTTAIDGITTVINAFGLNASDAARVADSMFTAVKGGKTTFGELSAALFNVAPAAAAAGVKMEEVNAAIATLTASGVPTSVATTQIRAALTGLQRPSAELDTIFRSLGFANAQAAIESKGFGFALDAVRDAAEGDNGKLQTLLGSVEAVGAANVLAGTGADKFASELDAQAKKAGATQSAFEEMEKSVARRFERIKVGLKNFAIEAGNALLPFVEQVGKRIGEAIDWFRQLDPEAKRLAGTIALVAAAVGPLLLVLGKAIQVFNVLKVALLTNPFTLILAGIAAAVVAFAVLYQRSDEFRSFVQGTLMPIVQRIGEAFVRIWTEIQALTAAVWPAIRDIIKGVIEVIAAIWQQFGDNILRVASIIWERIKVVIDTAIRAVKAIIDIVLGIIKGDWSRVWEGIKALLGAIWDNIVSIVKTAIGLVGEAVKLGLEVVRGIWDAAWEAIKEGLQGTLRFILDKILAAVEWITKGIAKVFGWVPFGVGENLKAAAQKVEAFRDQVNAALGGIKDKTVAVNFKIRGGHGAVEGLDAPGMAHGGFVQARPGGLLTLLGEGRHDEWVVTDPDMQKIQAAATNPTYGRDVTEQAITISEGAVQVNVNGTNLDERDVKRAVAEAMDALVHRLRAGWR